jgi:hypothetical protein
VAYPMGSRKYYSYIITSFPDTMQSTYLSCALSLIGHYLSSSFWALCSPVVHYAVHVFLDTMKSFLLSIPFFGHLD